MMRYDTLHEKPDGQFTM